ncbi:hypothetical protein RJ639_047293 [Escallonia herrerae]|uniref:MATH domain-containing protein n=1 Tax=Escallonia herrerae TaxID=1293975 RepID=A0AA89B3X9_9ASTE|nr:hypothetical protein RJ639_047293 [Escallonia herrerae]
MALASLKLEVCTYVIRNIHVILCFCFGQVQLFIDLTKNKLCRRLHLYPDGDKIHDADGYVSLYLVLAEAKSLPMGWEIDVNFRLFVHDQIRDRYYTIQDVNGKVRRFTEMKTEHGFAKLISLATFRDNASGCLVCDTCLFGAEVFVIQNTKRAMTCISMEGSEYRSSPVSWKVHNFSKLNHRKYIRELSVKGKKWCVTLSVSVSLSWFDSPPIPKTGPLKFANSCRPMISLTSSRFAAARDNGMWKLFNSTPLAFLHFQWLWKV